MIPNSLRGKIKHKRENPEYTRCIFNGLDTSLSHISIYPWTNSAKYNKELLVLLPTLPHCFTDFRPGRPSRPSQTGRTTAQKGELGPPDSVAELAMKVRSLDS